MATIRQTTRCDGKARFRSSPALALPIACSIAVHGIAVSKAFSTVPGSMACDIRENSLSCILADDTLATTLSLSGFRLNRTVLPDVPPHTCA